MGVWIETRSIIKITESKEVTPCVGVWIETLDDYDTNGLKEVTPCVGVWIETTAPLAIKLIMSHTLRGCVD